MSDHARMRTYFFASISLSDRREQTGRIVASPLSHFELLDIFSVVIITTAPVLLFFSLCQSVQ
jgi:hypothetical protein